MSGRGTDDRDAREVSRWVREAAANGEPDSYFGKRHARRFAEGIMLDLSLDPRSGTGGWTATMHNVSETGLSFWTRRDVPVGQVIQIREFSADNTRAWQRARVRHKTRSLQGFLVGVVFE